MVSRPVINLTASAVAHAWMWAVVSRNFLDDNRSMLHWDKLTKRYWFLLSEHSTWQGSGGTRTGQATSALGNYIKCSGGWRHSFCVNHFSNYHFKINGEAKSIWTFSNWFLNTFSLVFSQSLCIYLGKELLPRSFLLTRFCSHLLTCHYSTEVCFICLMEDEGYSVRSSKPTVNNGPTAFRSIQTGTRTHMHTHAHTTRTHDGSWVS